MFNIFSEYHKKKIKEFDRDYKTHFESAKFITKESHKGIVTEIVHDNHSVKCFTENVGVYDKKTSTWYWAWGYEFPFSHQLYSRNIKKKITNTIKDFIKSPQNEQDFARDIELMHYYSHNSIYISKPNLSKMTDMIAYYGKNIIIVDDSNENIESYHIIRSVISNQ